MPTIHIEADKEDIASKVLMPGDPYRAKYIAEKYLTEPKLVNKLRGELAYTGTYKGHKITVFSSGMGIGSMGIYSYELYNDYDVDTIIRIGTAGSYKEDLKVYDILLVDACFSKTSFDDDAGVENIDTINSSFEVNSVIEKVANFNRIHIKKGKVHTTEAFYTDASNIKEYVDNGCVAVEMETYALLFNAKKFHKKATTILTISDNLITKEQISSEERERKLDEMIVLALDSIIKL